MSLYSSCLETWDAWTIPWQSLATVWNWKTEALLRLLPQWSGCTRWQSHSFLLGYSAVGVVDGWYEQLRQLFLFCFTFAFIGIDSSFIEPIFRAASYFQHEQVMPGYRFFLDITHQSSSSLFSSTLEPKAQISWSTGHYSDWTRVSVSPWCWWWPPQLTLSIMAAAPRKQKSQQAGRRGAPAMLGSGGEEVAVSAWLGNRSEGEYRGGSYCPCFCSLVVIWWEQLQGDRKMWVEPETVLLSPHHTLAWQMEVLSKTVVEKVFWGPSEPSQLLSGQGKQPFVQYAAPPVLFSTVWLTFYIQWLFL